jgi:hypothetical protein
MASGTRMPPVGSATASRTTRPTAMHLVQITGLEASPQLIQGCQSLTELPCVMSWEGVRDGLQDAACGGRVVGVPRSVGPAGKNQVVARVVRPPAWHVRLAGWGVQPRHAAADTQEPQREAEQGAYAAWPFREENISPSWHENARAPGRGRTGGSSCVGVSR